MKQVVLFGVMMVALAGCALSVVVSFLMDDSEGLSLSFRVEPPAQTAGPTAVAAAEVPSTPAPTAAAAEALPALTPVAAEKGVDLADVALLYSTDRDTKFDTNFRLVADYYGLRCKEINLNETPLTDDLLKDEAGNYLKLVGISIYNLREEDLMPEDEAIEALKTAVKTGGLYVLVSDFEDAEEVMDSLVALTDGVVSGLTERSDSFRDWSVSPDVPEITREFTGQYITTVTEEEQYDFALLLGKPAEVTPLLTSTDSNGKTYTMFVKMDMGAGAIFIDTAEGRYFEASPFRDFYYDWDGNAFGQVFPLMATMRYAAGNEAWHRDHDYANLTVDDPSLTEPFYGLSYPALLNEMNKHNFHTTIGFIPAEWSKSEPDVVDLFLQNPDRYSLAQHGNNHDGYEFYLYGEAEDEDEMEYEARPFADQEADIIEGLARMAEHRTLTGISDDPVMIFPLGISPERTLALLKKYNYLATVNGSDVPLDAPEPTDWTYGMYPAALDYGNFPVVLRQAPGIEQPLYIFDLFVDKPTLMYTHTYEGDLFEKSVDGFNVYADQINDLWGEVEWQSLGYIMGRLYLEKDNDDGSTDVMMFTNHLIVTNESSGEKLYHIAKPENLNVPIATLTVNGAEFPYQVEDGYLTVSVSCPANASIEVYIDYDEAAS
ncbi:MAG: hypothetical protein JXB47_00090 [Anaerolineae bacterium]|nr:hypothetical protein [Anaerolineae bacterium]